MSDDGGLEDPTRAEPDVTDEQILTWYKNMITGTYPRPMAGWKLTQHSKYNGLYNVRGAETGPFELLHG